MLEIGIVGVGVVGKATASILEKHADIKKNDPAQGYKDDISNCDIIFICINEKDCEMTFLSELIDALVEQNKKCFFVIRTTVIPGTTDKLAKKHNRDFAFMPEFLREWSVIKDTFDPDKIVIGTEDRGIFETLATLFSDIVYLNRIVKVKPIEAELAKVALNSLALIKVVFAEELYDLAGSFGADYDAIYRIFKYDQNVNERHLTPKKDNYRGANGKCLPKDTDFLIKAGEGKSRMSLLETARILNELFLKAK